MEIDLPEVVAEVQGTRSTATRKRWSAMTSPALDAIFRDDPQTIRYGVDGKPLRLCRDQIVPRRALAGRPGPHDVEAPSSPPIGRDFAVASTLFQRAVGARQGRPADADLGALLRRLARRCRARQPDREPKAAHERDHANPRRAAARLAAQDAGRGTAAATCRRDRARRACARHRARRDRTRAPLRGVAHAGARGDPAAGGERAGRGARASRRVGGAAERRAARRHVRGDGGARGAVRGLCRRAHDGAERRALEACAREAARADPQSAIRSAITRSTRPSTARSMPARTTPISPK